MEKRKHIGLDFDDVIFDMMTPFIAFCNERFETLYDRNDIHTYFFEEIFNCTKQDIFDLFQRFVETPLHQNAPLIEGARESVQNMLIQHDVSIITGRQEATKPFIDEWTGRFIPELSGKFYFANSFGEKNDRVGKGEICKELGIDVFVEDSPHHLESILKSVQTIFLFDAPWNKELVDAPKNVERVHSWADLRNKLL